MSMAEKTGRAGKGRSGKGLCVPIGGDTGQIQSETRYPLKSLKKYRLDNEYVVLFVGRICADKGVELPYKSG
jgi:hypothetical protein